MIGGKRQRSVTISIQSLVTQVPAVKPGTHFVFLDLNCSHKRAEVFRKKNGLRELVWMLYADRSEHGGPIPGGMAGMTTCFNSRRQRVEYS